MSACGWCGDVHDSSRLCGAAQRSMTRRSFCFLFGAGIGATALLGQVPVEEVLHPPMDKTFLLCDELGHSTRLSFETREHIERGKKIEFNFQGTKVFSGRVTDVIWRSDGVRKVVATAWIGASA